MKRMFFLLKKEIKGLLKNNEEKWIKILEKFYKN